MAYKRVNRTYIFWLTVSRHMTLIIILWTTLYSWLYNLHILQVTSISVHQHCKLSLHMSYILYIVTKGKVRNSKKVKRSSSYPSFWFAVSQAIASCSILLLTGKLVYPIFLLTASDIFIPDVFVAFYGPHCQKLLLRDNYKVCVYGALFQ